MTERQTEQVVEEQNKLTVSQAAEILIKGREARVAAVDIGIKKLLKEYNCRLDSQIIFSANRGVLGGQLIIEPLPDQPTE